ncbi:intercompartmental signaling factor BofC [Pontibacillus litoralis]|uniref:Bypass-of-forespore protein C n=1 Tax=Pontibacillus litoralis JSM 072002 TaxID=1385512 RepID=A0A0A5G7B6_9BACI|nr:intercompartmental signaling factor BofC [Pontibacillus litoralis]KGX89001.1 bypass-of-forespore protein C [Pontibacillus litoralis JSM 072002]
MKHRVVYSMISLFIFIIVSTWTSYSLVVGSTSSERDEPTKKVWQQEPLEVEVVLQRQYVDGQIEEERKQQKVWSMEDFWASHEGWQLIDQQQGKVVFRKEVDALSPLVKKEGYFGISNNGELSIFLGIPVNNEVIESFYYLNTDKLEARDTKQLQQGIKVSSKEHYLSVLKQFEPYETTKNNPG